MIEARGAPPPVRILVVDDDAVVRELLRRTFERAGLAVDEVADGAAAVNRVASAAPDLVVLDISLPGLDGLQVLGRLRGSGAQVPVILLTGRGDEADRIMGLNLGADDYVVKPFSLGELVARVQALLRRSRQGAGPGGTMAFGDLQIDLGAREVRVRGVEVPLKRREFDLLACLARAPRQVLSRERLLELAWGSSDEWQSPATVTEHVHRLRQAIEDDPAHPRRIVTAHGVGYRFEP